MNKRIKIDRINKFIIFAYNFFAPFILPAIIISIYEDAEIIFKAVVSTFLILTWTMWQYIKANSIKILVDEKNNLKICQMKHKKIKAVKLSIPLNEIQELKARINGFFLIKKDGTKVELPNLTGCSCISSILTAPLFMIPYNNIGESYIAKIRKELNIENKTEQKQDSILLKYNNIFGFICATIITFMGLYSMSIVLLYASMICAIVSSGLD